MSFEYGIVEHLSPSKATHQGVTKITAMTVINLVTI